MEAVDLARTAPNRTRLTGFWVRVRARIRAGSDHRGLWPAGFIGALALILVIDGIVARVSIGLGHPSRLASSWEAALQASTEPEARAQILCFGDSLIKLGIVPRILEARLGQSAYNLAVLGGQPPTSDILFRRVLDRGHSPRAVVVNFSPLLLGLDPRVNVAWWAGLIRSRDRIELALRSRDARVALSLFVHGTIASLSSRSGFRAALGLGPFEGEERDDADLLNAMLRNWNRNRGAQVAPRPFVPIGGPLPRPGDASGWTWLPQPVHAEFVVRFLTLAQDRGIPVYWIIPPAEEVWLERNERVGTVVAYRRYVQGLVSRFAILTVLDMQYVRWDRGMFRDPIHLNRDGAVRLTVAVADAIANTRGGQDVARRWIPLTDVQAVASQLYDDLLEDLDQSRLAASQGEHGPITMEGPKG
jgi:hypothetical protein